LCFVQEARVGPVTIYVDGVGWIEILSKAFALDGLIELFLNAPELVHRTFYLRGEASIALGKPFLHAVL